MWAVMLCGVKAKSGLSWYWSGVCSTTEVPDLEKSQLRWVTSVCSQRWRYQLASWCSKAKCLHWDVWSDQCLAVDGCSSIDFHWHWHALKASTIIWIRMWATTGSQWSSQSRGGSQWRIRLENKAGCSRLVMEAGVDRAGEDQHLDLELCGILYEERLDPVDSPL